MDNIFDNHFPAIDHIKIDTHNIITGIIMIDDVYWSISLLNLYFAFLISLVQLEKNTAFLLRAQKKD